MKTSHITKKHIVKTVSNSQKIEGYKPASKSLSSKVKRIMAKYNVQVSAWWQPYLYKWFWYSL